MAQFYADEQFPLQVVKILRGLGHDVLTVQEAGNGGQGIPDEKVLAFAINQKRAILTLDREDFIRLHRKDEKHFGIIVCTNNRNWQQFGELIHKVVVKENCLEGKLIRVVRPSK
jgi:predicted nuclease of predicted toxin-antitoxin system